MARKLLAISDLHISAQVLDDFDAKIEHEFKRFISSLASETEDIELVINGDFLDFVQAPPYEGDFLESTALAEGCALCFSEDQSLEKLKAIYQAHPDVFTSLQGFLASRSGNQITILPGNHDADLFWTRVQSSLQQRIAARAAERFKIHLERVYRPPDFPGVWIEHGHQFDKINSFFLGDEEFWSASEPPIFVDNKKCRRLLECLGTRFMIRFLNRLDRDYPYVDNVKPFSVFVRLFAASALVSGYASLSVAVTVWRLLSYMASTGITQRSDLLSLDGEGIDATRALVNRLQDLNESDESRRLQQRVQKAGFKSALPLSLILDDAQLARELLEFLSEHLDILADLETSDAGYLSLAGEEGTLSLARGFRINESKELARGAKEILTDGSVELVIMGHTHEPQDRPGGLDYINTGSWTRYYQRTDSTKLLPWSLLRKSAENELPFALKYAVVEAGAVRSALLQDFSVRAYAV
jgi:UDP-2,3-diacylglucosamine pyrophosphatase LpxH